MPDSSLSVPVVSSRLPGVQLLRTYDTKNLSSDVIAGVSVAAVAIPIGIAYSQLAGAPPVVGIYSCLLAPVAYALFGSSRQLIVNPDAAACAIVAATTAPLAAGDPLKYTDLSLWLTLFTGVVCIVAGLARFGFIANFLSRPILVGYLNGIAISIIAGQLGRLLGIDVPSAGVFRTVANLLKQIQSLHWTTTIVGVSLLVALLVLKKTLPKIPGPVVAAAAAIAVVYFLHLNDSGVRIIGSIPSGLPTPRIPALALSDVGPLAVGAVTITLVSFCSMMTTARGFATKNNYQIDPNRDLMALGVCDLASGLTRGFVVSGADSRTAVADSAGGKTQMTSVVTSITIALVLLFLTAPLGYLPFTALAAILISASIGLFDLGSLRRYYRVSRPEFRHAVVAMLGVMTVGVLGGVLIAVGLAILRLLILASKPRDALLGVVPGTDHFVNLASEPRARAVPGVMVYRFESGLVFFNADYFATRVRQIISDAQEKPSLLVLDAESMGMLDTTGADTLDALHSELERNGIELRVARAKGWFRIMLETSGVADKIGRERLFPSTRAAVGPHQLFQGGAT